MPVIGDNVYIGHGAKLFGRITIGNGVAIGANSVVTYKEVFPEHSVNEYFLKVGFNFAPECFGILLINWILLPVSNARGRMLVSIGFSIFIPSAGYMLCYHKSDEWKYLYEQIIMVTIRKASKARNHTRKDIQQ